MSGKVVVGVYRQGLSKIFRAAIYRAHRAVVCAIAQLSCFSILPFDEYKVIDITLFANNRLVLNLMTNYSEQLWYTNYTLILVAFLLII